MKVTEAKDPWGFASISISMSLTASFARFQAHTDKRYSSKLKMTSPFTF